MSIFDIQPEDSEAMIDLKNGAPILVPMFTIICVGLLLHVLFPHWRIWYWLYGDLL